MQLHTWNSVKLAQDIVDVEVKGNNHTRNKTKQPSTHRRENKKTNDHE